jgi:aryl-alcohol dehydrogenase-like predicted oxidoreductase
MVRRQLGHTGLTVSPIGLGTTKFGRNTDVKYPASFALPSDSQLSDLLDSVRKLGVNLIDTAPAYGNSEQRLGAIIDGHRDEFVLCTKCGEQYLNGRSIYDFSAPAIMNSVEESLRRLRTEYIDVLLLHSDGRDVEILTQTDALEALTRLKRNGKIRSAGISAKTESGILAAVGALDVVMAPFSKNDSSLSGSLETAYERGMGILAIKGLSSGHLEAQAAIDFVLRQRFIDALVVGTINPTHLQTAVAVAAKRRGGD